MNTVDDVLQDLVQQVALADALGSLVPQVVVRVTDEQVRVEWLLDGLRQPSMIPGRCCHASTVCPSRIGRGRVQPVREAGD
jgi:hypothetical protein